MTMTENTVKRMLDAIREAQSDDYIMSDHEAEALFGDGENSSKPKPKVEPKPLPRKDLR